MASAENFSALRATTARLADSGGPLGLAELIELDQSNQIYADAFIHQYVHTPELDAEIEAQIWQTLYAYLQALNQAYISALQGNTQKQEGELVGGALKRRLDNLALLALYHYLRYQPLPDEFWLELHEAYQMAEKTPGINLAATGCDASYLQVLMLGTINRTNMLKWEIALVNSWLESWSRDVVISKEFDEEQHLYFVDLSENYGAHRVRELTPAPNYRYWHVDNMTSALETMQEKLEAGRLPPDFGEAIVIPNALHLVDQLLAEWSRTDPPYRRQRRLEERDGVSKLAQVVHGIFNVCQHVKNHAFAALSLATNFDQGGIDSAAAGSGENSWIIENESKFGFGAVVKADLNLWLKPGRLIALDYELNPDLTVVGVVRSIQQQSNGNCYAGIEVLSHTPTYVRLQYVEGGIGIDTHGAEPFPALYLARDEDRGQPAMLVMPSFQFVEAGLYQLRTQRQTYQVKLGDVVEQQYDWLRAGISTMEKSV